MGQESLLLADRGGEGGVRLEAESRMFWKVLLFMFILDGFWFGLGVSIPFGLMSL